MNSCIEYDLKSGQQSSSNRQGQSDKDIPLSSGLDEWDKNHSRIQKTLPGGQ
jgi:hypothetical protein